MIDNKSKLVSIIIPVYNVEKYIEECILSVQKQTYSNIEVILVNDGSTDNSSDICNYYSSIYNNVHIIHQVNQGVSVARNNAIKKANGEYLLFVDPDDIISEVYVEKMVKNIENLNIDMVECGYTNNLSMLYNNLSDGIVNIYNSQFIFNYMLSNREFNGYIWNKIFKRDIIIKNNISFEENILIWEDMYFVLKYLKSIHNVAFISDKLYYYRIRKNSACRELSLEKKVSKLKVSKLFLDLENDENSEFKLNAYKIYISLLLDIALLSIKNNKLSKQEIDSIFSEIKAMRKLYKFNFKQRIKLIILLIKRSILVVS